MDIVNKDFKPKPKQRPEQSRKPNCRKFSLSSLNKVAIEVSEGQLPDDGTEMGYAALSVTMVPVEELSTAYVDSLRRECEARIRNQDSGEEHQELLKYMAKMIDWHQSKQSGPKFNLELQKYINPRVAKAIKMAEEYRVPTTSTIEEFGETDRSEFIHMRELDNQAMEDIRSECLEILNDDSWTPGFHAYCTFLRFAIERYLEE